jgi:hypothetical protein
METEKHILAPISISPLDSCRGRGKVGVQRRIRSNRTPRAVVRTAALLIASNPAVNTQQSCSSTHETPTPTVILFLGSTSSSVE